MTASALHPVRRFLAAFTIVACLLLLGQVPVAHVASSIRPGAADTPIPTEEEQRTDVAEKVWQAQVSLRQRRHVTYQETVVPAPSARVPRPPRLSVSPDRPPPSVFPGAPRPLRC